MTRNRSRSIPCGLFGLTVLVLVGCTTSARAQEAEPPAAAEPRRPDASAENNPLDPDDYLVVANNAPNSGGCQKFNGITTVNDYADIGMTIALNFFTILFVYMVALPLGAIAAVKANSWIDYTATFIGYIGLATPNFLLALILYHKGAQWFGLPVGGLMGKEFVGEPMSWAKLGDIMVHMIVPIIVIGTSGMAAMVRIRRRLR